MAASPGAWLRLAHEAQRSGRQRAASSKSRRLGFGRAGAARARRGALELAAARAGARKCRRTPARCAGRAAVELRARPAAVSRAKKPRPSSVQRSRSISPWRSSRSTSRVMPLRLSSSRSASSPIRSCSPLGVAEVHQHLVGGEREAVLALELGVEAGDQAAVGLEHARARPRARAAVRRVGEGSGHRSRVAVLAGATI